MTQMTQRTMMKPSNISDDMQMCELVQKVAIQQNRQHSMRNTRSFISPLQPIKSEDLYHRGVAVVFDHFMRSEFLYLELT